MLEKCRLSGFADEINKSFCVQLAVLKELGQKYIELRAADGIGIADLSLDQAEELKRKMEQDGVRVSALGSPIGKIKITEGFAPHFQKFQHVVELAGFFETPYIRLFSFYIPEKEKPESYREEVLGRMEQLVEYAATKNVILLHENEKGIYGAGIAQCRDLMEHFYGSSFQGTFDPANFVQVGEDTLEAYEQLRPYTSYFHIKDVDRQKDEVVLAGEGDGNIRTILKKLEKDGYEGFLSVEPHLCSFEGLEKLEQSVRSRRETDGIAAYKKAYHRLQELLKEG